MRQVSSFARRHGKGFSDSHHKILAEMLPKFAIKDSFKFNQSQNYALEIGFGSGSHLAEIALRNNNIYYIGCEPYLSGVVTLLREIEKKEISNILIWPDDVKKLLSLIPNKLLSSIYILFADPWPKKKHHKRRLIKKTFLDQLILKTQDNGQLHIATDHEEYAKWILEEIKKSRWKINDDLLSNFNIFPDDWIKTKYQQRGLTKGNICYYFRADNTMIL